MATIPEDLRNLRDFPQYDATFQDHPLFRNRLEQWAGRTKKLANGLSSLADAFDRFQETGMEHYKAATSVIAGLQEVANICQNDSSNTVSSNMQKFVDALSKIWCYYEAFLGQTQMLNATPIRELANNFLGLTTLHEQVLEYRQEHLKAAEKFCACRHSSKLTDKSVLPALTEACYSSQKTYQLVLSKFVISLRQAHTIDMMSFMRRVFEFFLSKYAYHNFCTEVLKELEPSVNDVFSQTKTWRSYHEREMKLWDKLHIAVKKNVLAEYHHIRGVVPDSVEASPTWSGMAMSPLTAGRHMMKKMFPSQSRDIKQGGPMQSGEGDWEYVEDNSRRAAFADNEDSGSKTTTGEEESPVRTRRETVGEDMTAENGRLKRERRRIIRSTSNPDLLSSEVDHLIDIHTNNGHLLGNRGESPASTSSSETPPPSGMVITYSEDTTEAAAEAMEEFLQRPPGHSVSSPFRPIAAVLGGIRAKKKKKGRKFSVEDPLIESPLGVQSQREGGSAPSSPHPEHSQHDQTNLRSKGKGNHAGRFRRAKGSLLSHLKSHDPPGESTEVTGERSDVPESPRKHSQAESAENLCHAEEKGRRKRRQQDKDTHQPRLQISSPLARDWSGCELRNEELQSLVQPPPTAWSKTGYLWLRMQMENRYAWTHIWCVVDSESGEVKVQGVEDETLQCLENLMLCSTKLCTPEYIDRNYCFRVISPSSEHLFQALSSHEQTAWVQALQNCTAQALKMSSVGQSSAVKAVNSKRRETEVETVPDAMSLILDVPGNRTCADCSSSAVEWASINLGLVVCIECSGVHRGLGVHVSKVRSLNLDTWDRPTVDLMLKQGNKKANCYYEATLGTGEHAGVRKPATNASKAERSEFIQQKYVALAFTLPLTERTSSC